MARPVEAHSKGYYAPRSLGSKAHTLLPGGNRGALKGRLRAMSQNCDPVTSLQQPCDISVMVETYVATVSGITMQSFWQALRTQRWDDHRYYHHSRINQSLHLLSASSFVCAYCLIFTNPVAAALIGWLVAMVTRQVGHFFFEPKDYDTVNQATHEHKEDIKVGYNLRRKIVLMAIWALTPAILWVDPTLFGCSTRPVVTSSSTSVRSGLPSASGDCCSAPCTCSSSRTCRRVWSGRPRSSPTRFTTSNFIIKRRCTCFAGS